MQNEVIVIIKIMWQAIANNKKYALSNSNEIHLTGRCFHNL